MDTREELQHILGAYVYAEGYINTIRRENDATRVILTNVDIKLADKNTFIGDIPIHSRHNHINIFIDDDILPSVEMQNGGRLEPYTFLYFYGEVIRYTRANGSTAYGISILPQNTIYQKLEAYAKQWRTELNNNYAILSANWLAHYSMDENYTRIQNMLEEGLAYEEELKSSNDAIDILPIEVRNKSLTEMAPVALANVINEIKAHINTINQYKGSKKHRAGMKRQKKKSAMKSAVGF